MIIELYDHFFKSAFPRIAQRLGIVFTPVPVVDYILHSADFALKKYFGKTISDEGVAVLETSSTEWIQNGETYALAA